jgi:hypothetical protein
MKKESRFGMVSNRIIRQIRNAGIDHPTSPTNEVINSIIATRPKGTADQDAAMVSVLLYMKRATQGVPNEAKAMFCENLLLAIAQDTDPLL